MKLPIKPIPFLSLLFFSLIFLASCSSDDDNVDEPIEEILPPIVLDCNYFNDDRVLENDPDRPVDYIVTCWANVQGSLKIEPGVVIEFENHAGFYINSANQSFEIKGTAEEPVILTGTSKQKGHWRGIFLAEAHNTNNLIEHTLIEYAGSQNLTDSSPIYEGSLAIRGVSGTTPQALSLNHVEIKNGGSVGLDYYRIEKNASVSVSNVIITGNEGVPVKVSAEMAHLFDNTSSYSGNASDYLNITTDHYEIENQTVTWHKLDVPYLIDGRIHIKHNGHLTIEAGVEMQLRPEAYFQPYDGSTDAGNELSLTIQGLPNQPVLLKAYNGTHWGGIIFGFTQQNNVIDHAIIENAKGDFPVANHENTGAIYMHASPKLSVSNTTFRNLQNCTFYAPYDAYFENLSLSNITYENAGEVLCTP